MLWRLPGLRSGVAASGLPQGWSAGSANINPKATTLRALRTATARVALCPNTTAALLDTRPNSTALARAADRTGLAVRLVRLPDVIGVAIAGVGFVTVSAQMASTAEIRASVQSPAVPNRSATADALMAPVAVLEAAGETLVNLLGLSGV